ncbi:MAG TPA: tetratricopeptide repeat protein [Opitutaceae bacterium]|nr:tetratricopeptide repeat protein [Opitutaceae bacterium]
MTPQQLSQRLNEAVAHHKAGRLERAESIYRQIAPLAKMPLVYDLWGQLAEQQGRVEDAIRCYSQACRLHPAGVPVTIRLASALITSGRPAEAEKAVRLVLDKAPNSPEAWNALGFVLKLRGHLSAATVCHQRAITLKPDFVDGWVHYGLTLGLMGRPYMALLQHEKALELNPNHARARYGRAESLQKVYRMEEAIRDYDTYLKVEPQNLEARSFRLYALQNLDTLSREELFAEHCLYGKLAGKGPATLSGYDLSPNRRLRLAILSPDLRTHSCAYFIEPLIAGLDPAQFELYLYHDHFTEDAMSARLKKHAAVWRNFVGQQNAVVEKTIRADKPDILIDLAGHIAAMIRLPIFAKRLAPVQITYLGYPDTSGVAAMDYRFTDAIADPPGESDWFAVEKLVRFAPVAWAYQPPVDAPEVAPLPCREGGAITFGCFNSPTKFTDSLLTAWGRLLVQVPNSRLLLKGRDFEEAPVREHVLKWLQTCGIDTARVELLARTMGTPEHLAQYARVDIALDTFPYTGTTTTCEALWMGRPVVTLCGQRHAARVGASLLRTVGHPEWIVGTPDDYVQRAVDLARAPAALAAISAGLRSDLQRSALLDHAGQSACFARALRECWVAKTSQVAAAA